MKSLHIRNLEEETLAGLKRRARRHHRSLQKEVEVVLRDAAHMMEQVSDSESVLDRLHMINGSGADATWSREEIYDDQGR